MENKIVIPSGSIFKHNCVITGYCSGTPYLYTKGGGYTDGVGRSHVALYGRCDICYKELRVAMFHADKDDKIYPS